MLTRIQQALVSLNKKWTHRSTDSYPSRNQPFYPGSFGRVQDGVAISGDGSFTLSATVFATAPERGEQVILSIDNACLLIAEDGTLAGRIGEHTVSSGRPLCRRCWYRHIEMRYDAASGVVKLVQPAPVGADVMESEVIVSAQVGALDFSETGPIGIAARLENGIGHAHLNGKIESPMIFCGTDPGARQLLAHWDFSRGISTTRIEDVGPNTLHGELVNLPARAMTGSTWNAGEMCWRHAPDQYAAIHFHDDDIYDFGWATDFELTVPDDLPSGIYAARITCGEYEDAMPFFVCPPRGKKNADLCVLVSTFTYTIYGNHARPDFGPSWHERTAAWGGYPWNPVEYPEYGLSTYNDHL